MVSCPQAEDWRAAPIKGKKLSKLKEQLLSECGGDLFDVLQSLADAMPFKRRMAHQ